MTQVFFTSDTHYDHAKVIEYSKRPFSGVEEMNEAMVENWNAVVRPGDVVYHLGDFSLGLPERASWYASRLCGQKYLVFGNHDKTVRKYQPFLKNWIWHKELADVKVGDQRIVLCHYAMRVWNQSHRGAWQLFGHSHNSLRDDPHALQLDVGVDAWDMRPVSFEEIRERMSRKTFEPADHHGARGGGH